MAKKTNNSGMTQKITATKPESTTPVASSSNSNGGFSNSAVGKHFNKVHFVLNTDKRIKKVLHRLFWKLIMVDIVLIVAGLILSVAANHSGFITEIAKNSQNANICASIGAAMIILGVIGTFFDLVWIICEYIFGAHLHHVHDEAAGISTVSKDNSNK
ncbi:MAG: hypothetical protein Ta2E_04030 [Mycoplasmoidaceae bacterium]|nr:MAG: hypothetical protein Ta2E_04030 [Mycoplasmoidaceae bacterium]